jgi:cytochrome P450
VGRLVEEIDADDGDEYLTATVHETLRRRPVIPNAAPRLVKRPVEIGGWTYPVGVAISPNAYLVHHDPAIYPDPYAFRPERFVGVSPGTYTWIPFGGGRRRCLGASFALLEMRTVLRAVLGRCEISPGAAGIEAAKRRSITVHPAAGARVALRDRERAAAPALQPA